MKVGSRRPAACIQQQQSCIVYDYEIPIFSSSIRLEGPTWIYCSLLLLIVSNEFARLDTPRKHGNLLRLEFHPWLVGCVHIIGCYPPVLLRLLLSSGREGQGTIKQRAVHNARFVKHYCVRRCFVIIPESTMTGATCLPGLGWDGLWWQPSCFLEPPFACAASENAKKLSTCSI